MNYKITAVTALYNEEKNIRESIDSLLAQTIGFEENIQLILINDGSKDNSLEICTEYRDRYPDNITLINKENSGVSDSRNVGMQYIQGKYTVFFDGDDIWEKDAFQAIWDSFESFGDAVDTCTCRIKYIGDFKDRIYPLDYKYDKGRRIANLMEEPDCIQITIGNVVFRSEALKGHQFDRNMTYCEDSWFANQIIAEKAAMGIIPDAIFYYRKNTDKGNQSVRIVQTRRWFFDVIKNYYFKMFDFAEEKFGEVPEYFQRSIFYDIKWRKYNPAVDVILSDEDKKEHLNLLGQSIKKIDDKVILTDKDINQYTKLYLLDIKYGKSVINEAELKKGKYYFNGNQVLSLTTGSMFQVKTMIQQGDKIVIEGISKLNRPRRPYSLYAADEAGTKYPIDTFRFTRADYLGLTGEVVNEGIGYHAEIPVRPGKKYGFFADVDGQAVRLMPAAESFMGLKRNKKDCCYVCGDYTISDEDGWYRFEKSSALGNTLADTKFAASAYFDRIFKKDRKKLKELRKKNDYNKTPLKDQVAFVSSRADDALTGNLARLWDAVDLPKVKYSKARLNRHPEYVKEAVEMIRTSKVVVLDDYIDLRGYNKRPGQKIIQVWHASGAGKKFGSDGSNTLPSEDAMYHRDYDYVTVSAEAAREPFASAFALPVEKMIATGVARTDDFFDKKYMAAAKERIYSAHPEFMGKKIILYAPTFRDVKGRSRSEFVPELDFDKLSEHLGADTLFILCPHPVMTETIIGKEYSNVFEVRDVSTNDMMFVSDLLVTDYSSSIFEYSLLKKPMVFYCYDYDSYNRDFYMDFENEAPGPILKKQEKLFDFLEQDTYPLADDYEGFYEKYMGACDGHSTERIAKLIEDLYHGKA